MNQSSSSSQNILPNPKQLRWAHSTCSKEHLRHALLDLNITAIESDIVIGHELNESNEVSSLLQPVMAHPPQFLSDLTFDTFIGMTTTDDTKDFQHKHLKLDFKEIGAIDPALDSLHKVLCRETKSFQQAVFLNADILKGPGKRCGTLDIEADIFIEKCLAFIQRSEKHCRQCAFSIGWKVDCRALEGYTKQDIMEMQELIEKNNLLGQSAGVVLAVNARVLAKNPNTFNSILSDHPHIQLLAWTGTGEPPISMHQVQLIEEHFQSIGCDAQLGFDCQIASSVLSGMFYDSAVRIAALLRYER